MDSTVSIDSVYDLMENTCSVENGLRLKRIWPDSSELEYEENSNQKSIKEQKKGKFEYEREEPIKFNNTRKILIYSATKFFQMNVTTERFLSKCHSTKGYCEISENITDILIADAVIFHNADYTEKIVPWLRKANQPYVLWSLESQINDRFRPGKGVINWTMTPLRDSDVWMPYGHTEARKLKASLSLEEIWKMKQANVTAVWLASNCYTTNRRKELIEAIVKQGIASDLFGACGKPAPGCEGTSKQGFDCVKELIRKYKFYYSFENSNCKDYVTEKFWAALYDRFTVPIVLERKKYEDVGAPPNSFIAIDDFKNLTEFADHLKFVGADKKEYLKYHEWRNTHIVFPEHDDGTGFCELCRMLQAPVLKYNVYDDLREFRSSEKQCNQDYASKFLD